MAVHLPITPEAQEEAGRLMVTSKNMLNPSNGEPIVSPSQDMILGVYFLTRSRPGSFTGKAFRDIDEVAVAYVNNDIHLHDEIKVQGITPMDSKEGVTTY